MLIRLIRNKPHGSAITGRLIIDGTFFCNTLERKGYQILTLCYHVAVTQSPKFKRLLPIVQNIPNRSGIRIHAGNTIEHTTGCILVGDISPLPSERVGVGLCSSRKRLNELRTYLLNYIKQNPYEEIYIQLESPDPYPDADLACTYEQQAHIAESLERAQRLREEKELNDETIGL